jgi:protein SCO1/2
MAPAASTADYHGGLVMPPLPKPRFILTDASGAPFDFWSRTKGRVTLLFFGYTRCPDVCPMHMTYLAAALKKLPRDIAGQITVVFVTTDPDHDTAKVLRAWLDNFDKDFVGLTGTQSAIDSAQIAANIPPATRSMVSSGTPQVSHAAFVLAYTKDNLAHVIYPSGISQSDWLHDLPELVASSWNIR